MKKPLTFHFVTLFPELITPWMTTSIIGKAYKRNLFDFKTYQLRDFSDNRHRTVDDQAYGGGGGMVLAVGPLVRAVDHIRSSIARPARVIYFSPQGNRLDVKFIEATGQNNQDWILICGHYEGVDRRFVDGWVDDEISIGDFVISGGELPAVAFADALIRQCNGTLRENSCEQESFSLKSGRSSLLEYPQYTRPETFEGRRVPEILLSGDHAAIARWRHSQSLKLTRQRRPDLLEIDKRSPSST